MRRLRTVTVAAVALGAAAMVPGSGFGETRGALAEECPAGPDFNGDRCGDLVVADPDATVNGKTRAGRVNVLYGGDGGARHLLAQGVPGVAGTPETDDRFGAIVRAAHIDEDGFADLVVAVPSESVGSADDAGVIHVVFGAEAGLGRGKSGLTLRQGAYGIPGAPEAGDRFGASMAVNTTTGDTSPAPAIAYGVPGEDLRSISNAGVAGLVTFHGATGAVAAARDISQNSPGIGGSAEAGDRFGAAVEVFQGPGGFSCGVSGTQGFTLVVGAPGEDLGSVRDAGMIHLAKDLSSDTPLSQNSPGVSGVPETGDGFGASLALASYCEHDGPSHVSLAVGVPAEDIGSARDAGAVHLFRTDDDELPLPQKWSVSQDTASVAGTAESGDRFGATLALGGPWREGIGEPVIVGAPGEDLGSTADAGLVHVLGDLTTAPGDGDVSLTQTAIGESAGTGDRFGTALATRHDYLYVGSPDDVAYPQGVVHGIAWPHVFGTPSAHLTYAPGTDGVPTGASRFGVSLA